MNRKKDSRVLKRSSESDGFSITVRSRWERVRGNVILILNREFPKRPLMMSRACQGQSGVFVGRVFPIQKYPKIRPLSYVTKQITNFYSSSGSS